MLNVKQEKFIQNIVNGMSQRQAYKDAYNAKYKDEDIDSKASNLFNSDKVQARYKELMKKIEDEAIMSAKERMKWLTSVIKGEEKETTYYDGEEKKREPYLSDKMKALDILNKMTGEYTENLNLNDNSKTTKILESINRQLGNKNAK